jgi:hypothetical protein
MEQGFRGVIPGLKCLWALPHTLSESSLHSSSVSYIDGGFCWTSHDRFQLAETVDTDTVLPRWGRWEPHSPIRPWFVARNASSSACHGKKHFQISNYTYTSCRSLAPTSNTWAIDLSQTGSRCSLLCVANYRRTFHLGGGGSGESPSTSNVHE